MKFKDSHWEDRLNAFWNTDVVSQYNIFVNQFVPNTFFQPDLSTIQDSLKRYCDNLINVMSNFKRIKDRYTDKSYTANYLAQIQTSGNNDLQQFNVLLSRHFGENAANSLQLIEETLVKLNATVEKPANEDSQIYHYY